MKLTEQDNALFDSLNRTETGRQLIDYLTRLQDSMCDLRNLGDGDPKAKVAAADEIQKHIVDKIKLRHQKMEKKEGNQYE